MFDRLLVEIDAFSIREREIGCEFRRKPAGDTDLKPARVPI
jgi:hypothetical protein